MKEKTADINVMMKLLPFYYFTICTRIDMSSEKNSRTLRNWRKETKVSPGRGIFQWWKIPHFSHLRKAKFPIKYDKSQAVFHFERHIPANATTETAKNPKKKKKRQYSDNAKRFMNSILRGCSFRSLHFDIKVVWFCLFLTTAWPRKQNCNTSHTSNTPHTPINQFIYETCVQFSLASWKWNVRTKTTK